MAGHGILLMWVNFEAIEVEGEEEPLPALGDAKYHSWQEIEGSILNRQAKEQLEEERKPPLVEVEKETEALMPPPPSGRPPRKIRGEIRLPEGMQRMEGVPQDDMTPATVEPVAGAEERHPDDETPAEDAGDPVGEQNPDHSGEAPRAPLSPLGGGEGPSSTPVSEKTDVGPFGGGSPLLTPVSGKIQEGPSASDAGTVKSSSGSVADAVEELLQYIGPKAEQELPEMPEESKILQEMKSLLKKLENNRKRNQLLR